MVKTCGGTALEDVLDVTGRAIAYGVNYLSWHERNTNHANVPTGSG